MWTTDYYVRYISLPLSVDGVTVPNDDGTFDIYLNVNHSEVTQQRKLEHEMKHIKNGHFYKDVPVAVLEAAARGELTLRSNLVPYQTSSSDFQAAMERDELLASIINAQAEWHREWVEKHKNN